MIAKGKGHTPFHSNIKHFEKSEGLFSELKTNWYSSGTIDSADAWGYVSEG